MLVQPPSMTPRRRAMKGSSEVTGPQPRSPANSMGTADKQLQWMSDDSVGKSEES